MTDMLVEFDGVALDLPGAAVLAVSLYSLASSPF
jgi:hypothetical protein